MRNLGTRRERARRAHDPCSGRDCEARPARTCRRAQWRLCGGGEIYRLEGHGIALKPVQKPSLPVWFGGEHPDTLRRAALRADGWMGSGASSIAVFGQCVPILRAELDRAGRDPAAFPISKRVFLSVNERPETVRAELERWFAGPYRGDFNDCAGPIPRADI
jgi:alkanesulfonate monooxygenase SsuD/methylene tetrahydromethanopterin reductase-like flavin-dependent oxidoreductase (luciferase family)